MRWKPRPAAANVTRNAVLVRGAALLLYAVPAPAPVPPRRAPAAPAAPRAAAAAPPRGGVLPPAAAAANAVLPLIKLPAMAGRIYCETQRGTANVTRIIMPPPWIPVWAGARIIINY